MFGGILREMFVKMGLDVNTSSFAEGFAAVELLKVGIEKVGEAVKEMAEGFVEGIFATSEYAERVHNLSQQLGLSADDTQKLGYAASFAGVNLEEMTMSMSVLAKSGVKNLREGLLHLADQMKDASPSERLRIAQEKLGRSGKALIPVLSEGREKVEELFAEAPLMSEDAIKAGLEFEDSWKRMTATLEASRRQAFLPLLRPLAQLFDWIRRTTVAITEWKKTNWEKIILGVKFAAFALASVLGGVLLANIGAVVEGIWGMASAWTAAGSSALAAGTKAAIAFLPWLFIAAGLILAATEVYAAWNGKETLFEKLALKWNEFVTNFVKPHLGDSWVVQKLREALGVILDIQGAFQKLEKASPFFKWFVSDFGGEDSQKRMQDLVKSSEGGNFWGTLFKGPSAVSDSFGGGATPSATVSQAVAAAGTTNAPVSNFGASINLNVPPGTEAKDVPEFLIPKLDEWWELKMRETAGAVQ